MKWTYGISQKLQTASLLLGVMGLVILFNLIERHNVTQLNQSVTSIYNDRLVPAADIFYITEHLYEKRFVMESFLAQDKQDIAQVKSELASRDRNIATLVEGFEKTYLVESESLHLTSFREKARSYGQLEQQILAMSADNRKAAARALYETRGRTSLTNIVHQLAELTKVQTTVGNQLLDDSKGVMAVSRLLSTLQIVLTLIIGFMITSLISASRIMDSRKNQNANLN